MIYNLAFKYLETLMPTETIFVNARQKIFPAKKVPDRNILLTEYGGSPVYAENDFRNQTIQVLTRDISTVGARQLAFKCYGYLHKHFGYTFPAITIDGDVFPEIFINQISANAIPQSLGFDENGLAEFVANYRVFYKGEYYG